jgi:hypothetical protein
VLLVAGALQAFAIVRIGDRPVIGSRAAPRSG